MVYSCENDLCNSARQSTVGTLVLVRYTESCPKAALKWTLDTPRAANPVISLDDFILLTQGSFYSFSQLFMLLQWKRLQK